MYMHQIKSLTTTRICIQYKNINWYQEREYDTNIILYDIS
jgi:hypothetical protein